MRTRRLTRPLAIGAAVVVIGGGAAGIISASSSNGSAGCQHGTNGECRIGGEGGI